MQMLLVTERQPYQICSTSSTTSSSSTNQLQGQATTKLCPLLLQNTWNLNISQKYLQKPRTTQEQLNRTQLNFVKI